MINWHIVTSEMYKAGPWIDDALYFISDTSEIYRGKQLFTQAVTLFDKSAGMPSTFGYNRLYIDSATLDGYMRDKTTDEWKLVIHGVVDSVAADGTSPVTGKAVVDYVATKLGESAGVIDITWDAANRSLDITKAGNDTAGSLVLSGLANDLSYDNATGLLHLLNDQGEEIGNGVNLDLERFVRSGEVETDAESGDTFIVLYFDEAKTQSVRIKATDLIDVYTVENTGTLALTLTNKKISGSVKLSSETGNLIAAKDDGLFVGHDDTKMDKPADAAQDTIAIFDYQGNVVSAGKTLDELASNTNVYVGQPDQTRDEILAGKTVVKNDILIEVKTINGENKSYTAYVAVEAAEGAIEWVAMTGNYNAKDVYFPEDLKTTSAIGNIVLENGQATIPVAGKNLVDAFNTIFVKEEKTNLIETQPNLSLTFNAAKAYEVGTLIPHTNMAYSVGLNQGKYKYGPAATGVTLVMDTVTAADGANTYGPFTEQTNFIIANGEQYLVTDDSNLKVTAVAGYTDGVNPLSNLGNECPNAKITALASKTMTSGAITGYRNTFYGTLTNKDAFTSGAIRGLTALNKKANKGNAFNITVPVGAMRVVIAYPAKLFSGLAKVKDGNAMDADITSSFKLTTVEVEGVGGYTAETYNVYYLDYANANDTANTYKVTL